MKARKVIADEGNIRINGFVGRFVAACEAVAGEPGSVATLRLKLLREEEATDTVVYVIAEQSAAHAAVESALQAAVPSETLIAGYSVRTP